MARKVFLVVISVFFFSNLRVQALMAILLITGALMAHAAARPFTNDLVNWVEFYSLCASFLTFFAGQFLFIDSIPESNRTFATVVIFLANLSFHLCVIIVFGFIAREKCAKLKNEGEAEKQHKAQLRERVKDLDLPQSIDETEFFEDRLMADRVADKAAAAGVSLAGQTKNKNKNKADPNQPLTNKNKAGGPPGGANTTGGSGGAGGAGDGDDDTADGMSKAIAAASAAGATQSAIELANTRGLSARYRDKPRELYLGEEEMKKKAIEDAKKRAKEEAREAAALVDAASKAHNAFASGSTTSGAGGLTVGAVGSARGSTAKPDEKTAAPHARLTVANELVDGDEDDPVIVAARAREAAETRQEIEDVPITSADSDDDESVQNSKDAHPSAKAKAAAAAALKRLRGLHDPGTEALKYRKEPEEEPEVYDQEVNKAKAEWAQTKQAACTIQ